MAFNLQMSGGDYNPYISWSASDHSFIVKGDSGKEEKEISEVIIDFENLKVGWGLIQKGAAPTWVWFDNPNSPEEKPDDRDGWKQGVGLTFYFGEGELYDMDTSAVGAVMGLDEAHDLYVAECDDNKKKVAVFKYTGSRGAKIGAGSTRIPEFELVKWVKRPADLSSDDAAPAEQVEEKPKAKKAAGGSSQF